MKGVLTDFGKALSECCAESFQKKEICKLRYGSLERDWENNKRRLQALKEHIDGKRVIYMGPGRLNGDELAYIKSEMSRQDVIISSTHFLSCREDIEIDIMLSSHAAPLMAAAAGERTPKAIVHAVYSKVPPVIKGSMTVQWSDPYLMWGKREVTAVEVLKEIEERFKGDKPYIPAPRNAMGLGLVSLIGLGARQIEMIGFDPDNPTYFFSNNQLQKMALARALSESDPWIAAWDGRNERLIPSKDCVHRLSMIIANILKADKDCVSFVGSGWRYEEMVRALLLCQQMTEARGMKLAYAGRSQFMKKLGISHRDIKGRS